MSPHADGFLDGMYRILGSDRLFSLRENSVERMSMGPLPKPGVWTQLEVRAADLDMDGFEISAINFATHGGLTHFEQCVATSLGKETILTGEAIRVDGGIGAVLHDPVPIPARIP